MGKNRISDDGKTCKKNKVVAPEAKPRDREATRARLIKAVGSLLAREGFKGLGVNAVAREAGVDKVLIYRYFGGLPELIAAFGREGNFWPSIKELAGGSVEAYSRLPVTEQLSQLSRNFINAIRTRPITQEILAWEMIERNELTIELESVRENTMMNFFDMFFPTTGKGPDIAAMGAIIGAGVSYLVSRGRQISIYNGVDLQSDAGWQRLQRAIDTMIKGLFAGTSE
ncbi:Transcriptional regulator, AcrR family [Olavius algarvensis Delta 1 endosymbiont]|nr:Transcriptional regulator, AcrR family [Olavius algarvensis Delta 1 endosymbiont]